MADHDVTVLNTLIATTIDSANGFEEAAKRAKATSLSTQFAEFARDRWALVSTLEDEVGRLGGTPRQDGTAKAAVHRRWLDLRNRASGGDRAVLREVEKGETYIRAKYEAALQDGSLSEPVRTVITDAFDSVRQGQDRVGTLNRTYSVGLPEERQPDWRTIGTGVGLAAIIGGVVYAANRRSRRQRAIADTYRPWTPAARPAEAGARLAATGPMEATRAPSSGGAQRAAPATPSGGAGVRSGAEASVPASSAGKRGGRASGGSLAASGPGGDADQGAGFTGTGAGAGLGSEGPGVGSFGATGDDVGKK